MDILTSLGVDSTLWIQLVCFLVSYVTFSQLVLKPYMRALHEREKRTIGSEETAVRMIEEANELHEDYEKKARAISTQIKTYYDQSRSEAMREYDRLVTEAREQAAVTLEKARGEISGQIKAARQTLSAEIPAVGMAIASKLAGKEISL